MGGSSSKQTTGYEYSLGAHLVFCTALDVLREIRAQDKTFWWGPASANTQVSINSPGLFGGKNREGGIVGAVDIEFGGPSQAPNDYLVAKLGSMVSGHRGVFGLILRRVKLAANNPYIKPWGILGTRWSPAFAVGLYSNYHKVNDLDANPACILYECLTNSEWGMGYPTSAVDSTSFLTAANQLYVEGFGLSMVWMRQESIEAFVTQILACVGGLLYVEPSTGKFVVKLLRQTDGFGYALPSTPLNPCDIVEIESFQRMAWSDTTNEIKIRYRPRGTATDAQVTAQNLANIAIQGGIVSSTIDYPGIPTAELAARVAERELLQASTPLAVVRLKANRNASSVRPGDIKTFSWPELGILNMRLRVINVNLGTLLDGTVLLDMVEDVFSTPTTSYLAPQSPLWQVPSSAPAALTVWRIDEVPYYILATNTAQADLAYVDVTSGYLMLMASPLAADSTDLALLVDSGSGYEEDKFGSFTSSAVTATALTVSDADVTVNLTSAIGLTEVVAGDLAFIGEEILLVTAVNTATPSVSLARGVLDTLPSAHASGSIVIFNPEMVLSTTEYTSGQTVGAKAQPTTSQGELDASLCTGRSVTFAGRQGLPLPPGNLKMNSVPYHADVPLGDLVITWAHRNRLQQTAYVLEQDAASVTPEAGTTYTVKLWNAAKTVLWRTVTGLTGTTYTYTAAFEAADTGSAVQANDLVVELWAVRDGLPSWQAWSVSVHRPSAGGWGNSYGNNYGG